MPHLVKRFTLQDLPSENGTICNPIYMDNTFCYRSERQPFREQFLDKTLKISSFSRCFDVDISNIENLSHKDSIDRSGTTSVLSDARLFRYNDSLWLNLTLVNRVQNEYGHISQIAISSLNDYNIQRVNFSNSAAVVGIPEAFGH